MSETIEPLLIDMLEWIAKEERPYAEVMEAWRTSCPRLPVWEEANARGLVTRVTTANGPVVRITARGRVFVSECHASTR
jgi:D-3-phosphoglycerate dehydrogenase